MNPAHDTLPNLSVGGLVPLRGAQSESPALLGDFVAVLAGCGIPATWVGWRVYAEPEFAKAWDTAMGRYRKTPKSGARLVKLVRRLAAETKG